MNSFNTHEETGKIIQKYTHSNVDVLTFNQSRHPRILKETLTPLPNKLSANDSEWYNLFTLLLLFDLLTNPAGILLVTVMSISPY